MNYYNFIYLCHFNNYFQFYISSAGRKISRKPPIEKKESILSYFILFNDRSNVNYCLYKVAPALATSRMYFYAIIWVYFEVACFF